MQELGIRDQDHQPVAALREAPDRADLRDPQGQLAANGLTAAAGTQLPPQLADRRAVVCDLHAFSHSSR